VLGLTLSRKEIEFSFGESIKFRYLNLLMNFMKQESLLHIVGKFGKRLKKYQVFSKFVFPDFSVFLFFNSLFECSKSSFLMIKNILILIFKKAKECIELKRVGRDRHPCLNSVRRRLTTAYRSASGQALRLVFDTFRFVTSIAGQSRAKSFGHAERRQALTLYAIF
jgi:hypothetical protein